MRKRIQKGLAGIGGMYPATQNNGFGFASDIMGFQAQNLVQQMQMNQQSLTPPKINIDQSKFQLSGPNTTAPVPQLTDFIQPPLSDPSTARAGGNTGGTSFSESKFGKGLAMGAQVGSMLTQFIPDQDKDVNEVDGTLKQVRGAGQQFLVSSGNPLLMGIGAADMLIDKMGGHSDASQGLGTGTDIANAVASFVPGLGWLSKKTDKYSQDEMIKTSSAYTGQVTKGEKVAKNAGARLFFGGSKANDKTRRMKLEDANTMAILQQGRDQRAASNYGGISLGNQMTLNGGVRPLRVKEGAKLQEARKIIQTASQVTCTAFREGGKVNVIPEGAFHKNKHHMEQLGDEYKDLTTKGIPVVTEGKGGELTQQAEIERNEIIFNLDVTKKLEELMQDGSEEAALEAGKLLAIEIMENTIDNTGLIKEIS